MGAFLSAYQAHEQGKIEKAQAESQAAFARQQAESEMERAERIAENEEVQAIETARRQRREDQRRMDVERARMAGSGVSLTEGTPLLVQEEDDLTSMLNIEDIFNAGLNEAAEIRYQGEQNKRGLLWEAEQSQYQGNLAKYTARQKVTSSLLAGGTQTASHIKQRRESS